MTIDDIGAGDDCRVIEAQHSVPPGMLLLQRTFLLGLGAGHAASFPREIRT